MSPLAKKLALYAACGLAVALFSPVLPFRYVAAAGVILAGLALVDLLQSSRRGRR